MPANRAEEALLLLEDGSLFVGRAVSPGTRFGEVVFNTAMTGYQEILSDPSYRGQIVVMTAPQIANVGPNDADMESTAPQVEGFVVRDLSPRPASWRSTETLAACLAGHGIPGISDVDTRAITRHLRTGG